MTEFITCEPTSDEEKEENIKHLVYAMERCETCEHYKHEGREECHAPENNTSLKPFALVHKGICDSNEWYKPLKSLSSENRRRINERRWESFAIIAGF